MSLRYDEIGDILRLIDNSSCDELVLETPELKLVVRRRGAAGAVPPAVPSAAPANAAPTNAVPVNADPAKGTNAIGAPQAPALAATTLAAGEVPAAIEVRAPMVGTFYRAPKPDAEPFVEKDGHVEKGAPLCLIEVMKLFSTITSMSAGQIVHIGAENGELVEFGRVLFVIKPNAEVPIES
jgi:acetyl-CoA carboxylase biotin carboxyl carrier protein